MRNPLILLAVAPSLLAAAAPDDADMPDAQCLVAMGHLGSSKDEATRTASMMGAQYFFGRIDGRSPGVDLEALVRRAAEAMKAPELAATLTRCAGLMQQRGQALQAVGERMSAAEPAKAEPRR